MQPKEIIWNIGTGEAIKINQICGVIFELFGYENHPMIAKNEQKSIVSFWADNQLLRNVGWTQQMSIVNGIKDYIEKIRNEKGTTSVDKVE